LIIQPIFVSKSSNRKKKTKLYPSDEGKLDEKLAFDQKRV
jgi:hypothetical protein